jgi:death on curing protein
MPTWRYLTADELIEHGKRFRIGPVRDRGALDACMTSPAQAFDGNDLYPEVADKAAVVAFNIAKAYHPFVDGNKRTAAMSMLATCYLNGFVPVMTQAQLAAVILLVVEGEMSREDLTAFLRDRIG